MASKAKADRKIYTMSPAIPTASYPAIVSDAGDERAFIPSDTGSFAYMIMMYQGLANLFPWNAFITAAVYFGTRFCQTPYANSFESYFSFCGTAFQTIGLALSIVYQERFSLHSRIVYPLMLYSLIFSVTTMLVLVPNFNGVPLFWITAVCVTLSGLCGAVLSGGLFSMSAVFPPSYTAALMSGQALAGMVVSVSNLLTSLAGKQPEGFCSNDKASEALCSYTVDYAAFAYFLIATAILLAAAGLVYVLMKLPFTEHHMHRAGWEWCRSEYIDRILRQSTTSASINEPLLSAGFKKDRLSLTGGDRLSLTDDSAPIFLLAGSAGRSHLDDDGAAENAVSFHASKLRCNPSPGRTDSDMGGTSFPTIMRVLRVIAVPAFAVCFTFVVTLSIFPALIVLLQSEHKCDYSSRFFNDLYVPFYFLLLNTGDFLGRITAGWYQVFVGTNIWIPAVLRLVFIPLFLLCNVSNSELPVVFYHDVFPITFMCLFAFSNGYVASSAMMIGPMLAQQADKNLAGSIMIFCLTLGLMIGSILSFAIVQISQGTVSR